MRSSPAQARRRTNPSDWRTGGSFYIHLMIAVTFALPAESSEFLRRLRNKTYTERNGITIVRGAIGDSEMIGARESLRNRSIEITHTGVGEKICGERMGKFLENQPFDLVISAGFAGALDDELQVNELLIAKNFSTVNLKYAHSSLSNARIHSVKMLTVSALIDSSEDRERMARESGASAIDMETAVIARACAAQGIPLLSLRIITDTPKQPFPAPPGILFDIHRQRTHITALARFFLIHPTRIPYLVQFAKRIACARNILANALVETVRSQVGAIDLNGPRRFR